MNLFDYRLAKIALKFMFNAFFIEFNIKGMENIPDKGPVIVVSNHQSNLDPMIIFNAFPRPIPFMTKKELFKIPVFTWVMNQVGNFPVKRGAVDRNAMNEAKDRLDSGHAICIFPEGTRSRTGDINKFKSGIAYIWKSSGYPPILPMALDGSIDILKKGEFVPRPAKVDITFGKPIFLDKNMWNDEKRKESAGLIASILEDKVIKLYKANKNEKEKIINEKK